MVDPVDVEPQIWRANCPVIMGILDSLEHVFREAPQECSVEDRLKTCVGEAAEKACRRTPASRGVSTAV